PVFLAMRVLPLAASLVLVAATFVAARRGVFAATLAAVSPAVVFSARSFTPDALSAALVACAFAVAAPWGRGLAMGLAIGSMYSAGVFLPAALASVPSGERRRLALASLAGFVAAAPFTLLHPLASARRLASALRSVRVSIPGDFAPLGLAGSQLVIAVLFLV